MNLEAITTEQRTITFNGITYPVFNGNWRQNDAILTPTTKLKLFGEEYYIPSMGKMNRNTIYTEVNGFKKSSNQINGLIEYMKENGKSDKDIKKLQDDKARLAIIATKVMSESEVYEKDGAWLYYEEATLVVDETDYECKILIAVNPIEDKGMNISLSIMENKEFESKPPVRELNVVELDIIQKMNNGYALRSK